MSDSPGTAACIDEADAVPVDGDGAVVMSADEEIHAAKGVQQVKSLTLKGRAISVTGA